MEVWGGSQLTSQCVEIGGLDAWVYSRPYGDDPQGGDVYYASNCATGRISRLLLADVAGHGMRVATIATDLRALMRRFVNRLDQAEFVSLLNQQFGQLSRDGAFATAIVTTFFAPTRRLMVCNAGHPRPLIYRARERTWNLLGDDASGDRGLSNLPFGILDALHYEHSDVELDPGDCILAYTDPLIESNDVHGNMLGEKGVLRVLQGFANHEPSKLIHALLEEIGKQCTENLCTDDVTVLLIRANGRTPRVPISEKITAVSRFLGTLIRSVNPRAERAPFPDANLANLGGAILPVLAKTWRARANRQSPLTR